MKKYLSKILVFIVFLFCLVCPMMFAGCGDDEEKYTSVTAARNMNPVLYEDVVVQGYYVGVAQEGVDGVKEVLIKDTQSDDVIAIRGENVWSNFNYKKGALINIKGIVCKDRKTSKNYIISHDFTLIKEDNSVSYKFNNLTALYCQQHIMQYFKKDNIKLYSYVKFVGPVYYNQQATTTDNINVFRIHMNNEATEADHMIADNGKMLHVRENVLAANIGNGYKYVNGGPDESIGKYNEYTVKSDELICLVTGVSEDGYELTILDESWIIKKDQTYNKQDAIVEVAKAYYRQGNQIRYDQQNYREHMNPSPEDATSQNVLYLDSSSFINAVYNESFGQNVINSPLSQTQPSTNQFKLYAQENNYGDVVLYQERNQWTKLNKAEQVNYLTNLRSSMQVGDVLSYRRETGVGEDTGHCLLYLGNNAFIHCIGISYSMYDDASTSCDTENESIPESKTGSIYYLYGDRIFNPDLKDDYYLFKLDVSNFCILRPLNREMELTDKTKARMTLRDLEFEKTVDVGVNTAVYEGRPIEYSLKIKNNSQVNDSDELTFEDVYDSDLSFYFAYVNGIKVEDENITNSNNKLSFKIGKVEAGQITNIEIYYHVIKSSNSDKLITSNQTKINGVNLSKVVNTISGYSEMQMNNIISNLAAVYITYQYMGTTLEVDPVEFINTIYNESTGKDIFNNYTTADEVMAALFTITNPDKNDGKATVNKTNDVYKMVAPNLYGGYHVRNLQYYDNGLVRLITVDNLSPGDIILAVDKSGVIAEDNDIAEDEPNYETVAYIYLGEDDEGNLLLVKFIKGEIPDLVMLDLDPTKEPLDDDGNIVDNPHVLVTLPAYDTYAVFRPSMTA